MNRILGKIFGRLITIYFYTSGEFTSYLSNNTLNGSDVFLIFIKGKSLALIIQIKNQNVLFRF